MQPPFALPRAGVRRPLAPANATAAHPEDSVLQAHGRRPAGGAASLHGPPSPKTPPSWGKCLQLRASLCGAPASPQRYVTIPTCR